MTANYTVVIEREDDGRYSVYVPDLPGWTSMGRTRREAAANAREAIACYLEGLHAAALAPRACEVVPAALASTA